jgi:pyridoxal phosphate enzyme (YggS family)
MNIQTNITEIKKSIAEVCTRCGRNPDDVKLVAVSKTKPAAMINDAAAAGQELFGESYVQDFLDKVDDVTGDVQWHFIGGLQSNKVKYLRGKVAMIHSVDRLSLAEEINKQWQKIGQPIDILIQVNLGGEVTKSGTDEAHLSQLVRQVAALPMLRIKGLMSLPPWFDDPEEVRPFFRRLKELADAIKKLDIPDVEMQELSMGMSHDFEVAIEEGATMIRIGTAIFGARG